MITTPSRQLGSIWSGRPSARATAVRMESMEKAMSASSTEMTVPQNPLPNRLDFGLVLVFTRREEMRDGEVQQVESAHDFERPEVEEEACHADGDEAENEGSAHSVSECPFLLVFGQVPDHDGQHERIVRAQEPFEKDEPEHRPDQNEPHAEGCLRRVGVVVIRT